MHSRRFPFPGPSSAVINLDGPSVLIVTTPEELFAECSKDSAAAQAKYQIDSKYQPGKNIA